MVEKEIDGLLALLERDEAEPGAFLMAVSDPLPGVPTISAIPAKARAMAPNMRGATGSRATIQPNSAPNIGTVARIRSVLA